MNTKDNKKFVSNTEVQPSEVRSTSLLESEDIPVIEVGTEDCPLCGHTIWEPLSTLIANCPDAKFYNCGACGRDLRIADSNT